MRRIYFDCKNFYQLNFRLRQVSQKYLMAHLFTEWNTFKMYLGYNLNSLIYFQFISWKLIKRIHSLLQILDKTCLDFHPLRSFLKKNFILSIHMCFTTPPPYVILIKNFLSSHYVDQLLWQHCLVTDNFVGKERKILWDDIVWNVTITKFYY